MDSLTAIESYEHCSANLGQVRREFSSHDPTLHPAVGYPGSGAEELCPDLESSRFWAFCPPRDLERQRELDWGVGLCDC